MASLKDNRLRRLLSAMRSNERLDGAAGVLREPGRGGLRKHPETLAPVVLAASEVRDHWPIEGPESDHLAILRRFEKLSLAARLTFAADLHKTDHLVGTGPGVEIEDTKAAVLADTLGIDTTAWPCIPAPLIVQALSTAAAALEAVGGAPPSSKQSLALQNLRGGLNLVGVRIQGDLNLYNAVLPFPVRLIGCVIEGTLVADHAQMAALDLSGSALRGVSANFLKLNGSLRLRRTYCAGPVDFGGAHIGGVMDLSDSVITPLLPQPKSVAFAGDRGAVNLSLATIENELRFSRARIYGGLTMKGGVVRRSMFLEKALICSPVAALAKMALDPLPSLTGHPDLNRLKASLDTDHLVAKAIFPSSPDERPKACWRAAEVHGLPKLTQQPQTLAMMHRLLAESMRARTCAIRADGVRIEGSLFGRGLTTMGRLRIKYGIIQGGVHLDGTHLRSPRESFDTFDALDEWADASAPLDPLRSTIKSFVHLKNETKKQAQLQEKGRGESYALDIRETSIEGTVSLGPSILPRDSERATEVHGAIIASQAQIGSGLFLQAVKFSGSRGPDDEKPTLDIEHTRIGCDLDLRDANGVQGIKAAFSEITGNLLLCAPPDRGPHTGDTNYMVQPCRASGKIELRSAQIGGDAWLVFDSKPGPDLHLRQLKVAGSLNIFPMPTSDEEPKLRHANVRPEEPDAPDDLSKLPRNHPDRAVPTIPTKPQFKAIADRANDHRRGRPLEPPIDPSCPGIDLSSARVTVFRHPPTAWPEQGRLQLVGFVYEAPGTIGPLGVAKYLEDLVTPDPVASAPADAKKSWTRVWYRRLAAVSWEPKALLVISVLSTVVLLLLEHRRLLAGGPLHWLADSSVIAWIDRFGLVNLGLLSGLTFFCLTLAWTSIKISPTKYESKPLGAYWLRLQAHIKNPFRQAGIYAPTDPYLRAANALREVGKVRSAEWIELERARARTRLLSLRHHFLAKVALWTVDRLADFGFNVGRVVFILAFAVLIGACVFEFSQTRPFPTGGSHSLTEPSIMTSLETVVPLLGHDEEDEEVAAKRERDLKERAGLSKAETSATETSGPPAYLQVFAWFLRVFGLLLCAVIGASLAARAETFLSRMQT